MVPHLSNIKCKQLMVATLNLVNVGTMIKWIHNILIYQVIIDLCIIVDKECRTCYNINKCEHADRNMTH